METNPSFDLNPAIENWRANLAQSPAFRSENLYELETHLRESIAALERQGLSAEEAFLVGLKRIGKGPALEAEFAKQNSRSVWLDRALWVLIGAQIWLLASSLSQHFGLGLGLATEKVSAWLTTYGLGEISGSASASIIVISMFPLTLLIGVALLLYTHRWAKRRGWDIPAWLLQRPKWLAAIAAFIVLLPTALNPIVYRLVSLASLERVFVRGYTENTMLISLGVNTLLLAAVVYILGQRRLRLRKS